MEKHLTHSILLVIRNITSKILNSFLSLHIIHFRFFSFDVDAAAAFSIASYLSNNASTSIGDDDDDDDIVFFFTTEGDTNEVERDVDAVDIIFDAVVYPCFVLRTELALTKPEVLG